MTMWLRQSTASQEIQLGKFCDSTDGVTAETALTINNTDIKLWKEGATSQVSKNSGGATHIANGWYYAVLDATDTASAGKLEVTVDVSGALSVRREFLVVPAMIYDSVVLGTDRLDTNVTHIADTSQTARDIGASVLISSGTGAGQLSVTSGKVAATIAAGDIANNAITAAAIATGAIDADAIASDAITAAKIATDAITAAKIAAGAITNAKFAAGAIDAAAIANGAIDAATFAADVDAEILSYLVDDATRIDASALNTASGAIGSNGSGLTEAGGTGDQFTAIPWNASWDAEVQSEVDDAIVTRHLHRLIAATGTISNLGGGTATQFNTDLTAADSAYNDQVLLITSGALAGQSKPILAYDQTNGQITLEEGFTDAPSNGVTFVILSQHVHPVSQIQNGLSTHSAADVWSVTTRAITDKAGFTISGTITTLDALDTAQDAQHTTTQNAVAAIPTSNPSAGDISTQVASDLATAHGAGSWETATGYATPENVTDARDAIITALGAIELTSAERNAIADALLDRTDGVEANRTVRHALRLLLSMGVGKLAGADGNEITIRDTNDTKNRVTATVDEHGNRTAVTLDAT